MRILWIFRNRISSFSLVQMLLKTCHEILVLEDIGVQNVGSVQHTAVQFNSRMDIKPPPPKIFSLTKVYIATSLATMAKSNKNN